MAFSKYKPLLLKFAPIAFLVASQTVVYLLTLAPGLSWANDGADGGDFISAAATGGIAHPTGYPLYLLIAKLFQLIPIGSLALRTNLLSTVAAIFATVLLYGLLVFPSKSPAFGNWVAGLGAAFALGFSPVFWSQAVITEVYTLHTALVALNLLLCIMATQNDHSQKWAANLSGLVSGLAVGNHLTAIFLFPITLLSGAWKSRWKLDIATMTRILLFFSIGLLIYLALPFRAIFHPVINWGNPLNLKNFVWLVSGDLYQRNLMEISGPQIIDRFQAWALLILRQFEFPGLTLSLIGLIYYFKPNRLYFITIYNAIVFSLFAINYSSFDSYVYLLPVFLSFAVWIGLGLDGLLRQTGKFRRFTQWITCFLLIIWFVLQANTIWPQVDASHDIRAEQFGNKIMRAAPTNAIVFTTSDRAIFTLWYFHFALRQRPDLTVIATDLLHFEWYAETLRTNYPSVNWPEGFLWVENVTPANVSRPICQASYYEAEIFVCESTP